MITLPLKPGRMILNDVALRQCPLLTVDEFIRFGKDRNLEVSKKRLHRFERLGLLRPIVRIRRIEDGNLVLSLDGAPVDDAFDEGYVIDTSAPDAHYEPASVGDKDWMPLYSTFQVWELERVVRSMDYRVTLDLVLLDEQSSIDWNERIADASNWADTKQESIRSGSRAAIVVLGQYISNAYYPFAQSDQRTVTGGGTTVLGGWLQYSSGRWDWWDFLKSWDPGSAMKPFSLDSDSLRRAYRMILGSVRSCDPMWEWADLVRFVSYEKREQLRGDALRAQTYLQLAEMLRRLHRNLFDEDLNGSEGGYGVPSRLYEEDEVKDLRETLQYVVNDYNLNPQPKACLFVEGDSEMTFVDHIYEKLFGNHYGVAGIQIVNLKGVDNATGTKRGDGSTAILRLADHLHDQQTLVYLMLDNENRAAVLRQKAQEKRSLYGYRKYAIPPARIKVWKTSFEWDNFSDSELALALTSVAAGSAEFARQEVHQVRADWRNRKLEALFLKKTGTGLSKPKLAKVLADLVVHPSTSKRPENRPVVEFLIRIHEHAVRNPFPVLRSIWEHNQQTLDQEPLRRRR